MEPIKHKALLLPLNSKKELLIQDRRGYKKPDWGFFGGSIEEGEAPLQAVIRETKEELGLSITPEQLIYIGTVESKEIPGRENHMFLYQTDQEVFTVFEGAGAHWMSFEEANKYLAANHRMDEVAARINKVVA